MVICTLGAICQLVFQEFTRPQTTIIMADPVTPGAIHTVDLKQDAVKVFYINDHVASISPADLQRHFQTYEIHTTPLSSFPLSLQRLIFTAISYPTES